MRTLILGDVHGAYKALTQVLERANYDPNGDHLIFLGDVADGWPQTKECFDFIVDQPNKTYLLGNHDSWLLDWARFKTSTGSSCYYPEDIWWTQGGKETVRSYYPDIYTPWQALKIAAPKIPEAHFNLLNDAKLYHVQDNCLFVHAGVYPGLPMEEQTEEDLIWNMDLWGNRILWSFALERKNIEGENLTSFKEAFIGHTSTWTYSKIPIKACEIWNLDQGCGWEGKLSIMDFETKEYWQSDITKTLYPGEAGRR